MPVTLEVISHSRPPETYARYFMLNDSELVRFLADNRQQVCAEIQKMAR